MDTRKTYFLVPGWTYSMDSITLGSIITNPAQPEIALVKSPSIGNVDSYPEQTGSLPNQLTSNNPDSGPGLFGTFINQYGLGNEESLQYDRKSVTSYSFSQMKSEDHIPDEQLITRLVDSQRVGNYLRETNNKMPIYMITGIKSVRGAGVTVTSSIAPGWQVSLSVGAAPGSSNGLQSVVYAFQVSEVIAQGDGEADSERSVSLDEFNAPAGSESEGNRIAQEKLDKKFGEGTFTLIDGFDEIDEKPCLIVTPSLAPFDILTAGSARTDPTALRGN
ncbi:hypothetical protein V8F33_006708 [Rhypophila sp. PSN 637]